MTWCTDCSSYVVCYTKYACSSAPYHSVYKYNQNRHTWRMEKYPQYPQNKNGSEAVYRLPGTSYSKEPLSIINFFLKTLTPILQPKQKCLLSTDNKCKQKFKFFTDGFIIFFSVWILSKLGSMWRERGLVVRKKCHE